MIKKYRLSFLYILLWLIPIIIFMRDFFYLEDLRGIDFNNLSSLLKISLKQGVISVIFSFLVGILPAYYMSYKRNKITKLLEGLIFIPFFFPTISTVIAFSLIFNLPFLKDLNILYSLKAIVLANVFYNSPIMLKYISQGIREIPKNLIEAGRLEGIPEREIFFKIKLPLIAPQVFRGMFLVFIYSFTSFAIVMSLGGIKYWNLEVEIANTLLRDADFTKALVLGFSQFILLITLNILGSRIPSYELSGEEKEEKLPPYVKIYSILYLVFEGIILLIGIVYGFFNPFTSKFSFEAFMKLFDSGFNKSFPVIESIGNSILLAGITPIFVILFTYLLLKNYNRFSGVVISSTMGISSAFLGIFLIYLNILYSIPLKILLMIGYFLITVPIAYSFMFQYIVEFPKDILDLAKLENISSLKRFFLIEFPILKKVFLGTYLQIFAIILGEFTLSYTMQLGAEYPTLSLVNYSLYSNKKILEGASLSSLNIIIIGVLFILSNRLLDEKERIKGE